MEERSAGVGVKGIPISKHESGVITTRTDELLRWGRKNSLWPLPFGTACCAIEFMGVVSSPFDISRFGAELVRFSPRQSDLMIVAGTINYKIGPVLKRIYDQMCEPKYVISMGACACSGGFYDNYAAIQGIDQIIPVDVFIPGCPPRPDAILNALVKLQEKIDQEPQRGPRHITREHGKTE
ncbi:MAG: NADH-quinone oxidoreductase subunit NuoB [Candidatus Latescibacterota bacterium]|nr:MAG: NADH-quinone oxidoreductase subunit NuoB [Candidatus Latescibacterota bacterium]